MSSDRFQPQAARAMASMFDDVSGRYDLINRVMTLGQDGAWRAAMWREVPADARVVLDLCTGSGVSLPGLRRPGRLVLGMDVSFAMLEVARDEWGGAGWAPRLACADAFRLPLADGSLDAVTVAFGVRNLRPRPTALAELSRVLRPGGTLVVLEAAAPAPGAFEPFHALWLRHMVPAIGRFSPDPTAYRYLSESIFEFGAGPEFERDLRAGGFAVTGRRAFLLGATRLWVARRAETLGQNPAVRDASVHFARPGDAARAGHPAAESGPEAGGAAWLAAGAAVSLALTVALAYALVVWSNVNGDMPLAPVQRIGGWVLLVGGLLVFGARTIGLALRASAAGRSR